MQYVTLYYIIYNNDCVIRVCVCCEMCLRDSHHSDVILDAMACQSTSFTIVYSTFIQAQIKENIEALRHWPLCREFTGHRWIPRTIQ